MRRIHLFASLVTATFLLIHFLSGAVLVAGGQIFPRALTETLSEQISVTGSRPEADNIAEICKRYSIHGEETVKTIPGNKKSYSYFRPAYRAEILLDEAGGTARIKISEGTIWSVMNDFHRLGGYTGGWSRMLWSLLYDLSCISMIILAITGLFLWWKMERSKRLGTIFLFVSSGITVFIIMYIIAIC